MNKKYKIPDGLKDFCRTVWIFTGVVISLLLLTSLCEQISMGWMYDLLCSILYVFWHLGFVVPPAWITITVIWCGVIAQKENNKKIFFHPAVVITNIISVIYICVFTAIFFTITNNL